MRRNPLIAAVLQGLGVAANAARQRSVLSRRSLLRALLCLPAIGAAVLAGRRAPAATRLKKRGSSHAAPTIAAVINHMLPADDLPGARALGIDRRIASTPDPELKQSFSRGAAWLDAHARGTGMSDFLALDEAGKEAALQAALASGNEGVGAVVRELRHLALSQYYTHPTIAAAFAYTGPPQPAGFSDFQEAPR